MACGLKTIKYLLFGFNALFWASGAVILAMGIWTKASPGSYDAFLGNKGYKTSANVMLAAGSVVMVVGFLGCCGAVRESKCMLGWYFAFLFLIFGAEITAGILAFVYKDEVKVEMKKEMNNLMNKHYGFNHETTFDIDHLQTELKCCGVRSYRDWNNSIWHEDNMNKMVPPSCCKSDSNKPTCYQKSTFDLANIYTNGCLSELEDFVQKHLMVIGATGVAISCIQLLGMMFSCALFCSNDI
ncbi:CD151 antigen-like isoform X2 [Dendronephthya gigantea]|uniref:CD151 antigen-like isoform X2 n=1 Tax=Dendronephthya gigantea TaxID=151771 RepID=UPI0010693200|nr:CD151 antigen-like isoform X2 [Dendronephthya gigantea]